MSDCPGTHLELVEAMEAKMAALRKERDDARSRAEAAERLANVYLMANEDIPTICDDNDSLRARIAELEAQIASWESHETDRSLRLSESEKRIKLLESALRDVVDASAPSPSDESADLLKARSSKRRAALYVAQVALKDVVP